MENPVVMEGIRSLCDSTVDGLKMEQLDEGGINLAGIYIMSIINYQFGNSCFIPKKVG